MTATRRDILGAGAALLAPLPAWAANDEPKGKSRLILLGTGGGPTPKPNRSAPSQVIVVNGMSYVIDCGNGVARQMVLAGVKLDSIRNIFITHQHSDHNADYGNLLWLSWAATLASRVDAYGPPPLEKMTRLFLEMNDVDIRIRMADEGRPPLKDMIAVHELDAGGIVMRDANVWLRRRWSIIRRSGRPLPIASIAPTARSSSPATHAPPPTWSISHGAPISWSTK